MFSKIFNEISMKLARSMSNLCRIRYPKFRVDNCKGFGVIAEIRVEGGRFCPPPSGALVNKKVLKVSLWSNFFTRVIYEKHGCLFTPPLPLKLRGLNRASLGGRICPPTFSRIFAITPKLLQISTRNLRYLILHQFDIDRASFIET